MAESRSSKTPGSVLVLSTGRTGTAFLADFFARSFEDLTAVQEEFGGRRIRLISHRRLSGRLSRDELRQKLRKRYRPRLERLSTSLFFEANPYLCGCLDVLDELHCDPVVVHIVRDPREYIRSHINFGTYRGLKGVASRFVPFWDLRPEQCEPESGLRWAAMPPHARLAWRWRFINEHLERGAALFPGRYYRIAFEDIFAPGAAGLKEIVTLCGLSWRPELWRQLATEQRNGSRGRSFPRWHHWSSRTAREVSRLCAPLIERYGYGTEPEWQEKLRAHAHHFDETTANAGSGGPRTMDGALQRR